MKKLYSMSFVVCLFIQCVLYCFYIRLFISAFFFFFLSLLLQLKKKNMMAITNQCKQYIRALIQCTCSDDV
jgi:hypothetical protein